MRSRFFFLLLFLLMGLAYPTYAQSGSESESESTEETDPFKNDPFFSKPLGELLGTNNKPEKTETKTRVSNDPEDSTRTKRKERSEARRLVSRISLEGLDYGGVLESGPYSSIPLYNAYPTLPMIHFNRVDALFLGIRIERMQWYNNNDFLGIRNLSPHGLIGYSFGQEEWNYEAGIEKFLGFNEHILIGGEFYDATTTSDAWRVGLSETSLTSFFAGYDYQDYYKQKGWGAYLMARTHRLFEGGVSYNNDRFNSLQEKTTWALFGSHGRYRVNPPIEVVNGSPVDTISISSLSFSASFNPRQVIIMPHFTFSLTANMEMSDHGFASSDYDYRKYTAELISYFNFEPGSILKYRLLAGSITGDAPLFKEFQLGGPGTLRAVPYKAMPLGGLGGNKMILSTAEIQFGSTNWGHGGWIDFDDFYLSLFLDSGWVSDFSGDNAQVTDGFADFDLKKMEQNGGIGLGTNFLRVEAAWDLNQISRSPMIWVRFNPTF